MLISEEKRGQTTVFTLEGRLDSASSNEVDKKILDSIESGSKNIVLDFSSLDYISSAGIRVLVHCHKEIEKQKGRIFLAAVPPHIENVLYITGFLPYFKVYDTTIHALKDLR